MAPPGASAVQRASEATGGPSSPCVWSRWPDEGTAAVNGGVTLVRGRSSNPERRADHPEGVASPGATSKPPGVALPFGQAVVFSSGHEPTLAVRLLARPGEPLSSCRTCRTYGPRPPLVDSR